MEATTGDANLPTFQRAEGGPVDRSKGGDGVVGKVDEPHRGPEVGEVAGHVGDLVSRDLWRAKRGKSNKSGGLSGGRVSGQRDFDLPPF